MCIINCPSRIFFQKALHYTGSSSLKFCPKMVCRKKKRNHFFPNKHSTFSLVPYLADLGDPNGSPLSSSAEAAAEAAAPSRSAEIWLKEAMAEEPLCSKR